MNGVTCRTEWPCGPIIVVMYETRAEFATLNHDGRGVPRMDAEALMRRISVAQAFYPVRHAGELRVRTTSNRN